MAIPSRLDPSSPRQRSTPASASYRAGRRARHGLAAVLLAGTMLGAPAAGWASPPAQAATQASGAISPQMPAQRLADFTGLVKQVKPAVVSITSMLKADAAEDEEGGAHPQLPFPFQTPQNPHHTIEARGSGFIISPDGLVVTNNHVVKGATSVSVMLDDGTALTAKVIGRDSRTDLALLRVKPTGRLPFIQLGDSDEVEPGQWVVAVGNPFGLGGTVTAGIVSARGRDIGEGPYDSFLQIDAPINLGNSGGPLFTQDGKVVGVNTAIFSPSGGSVGIGFAIPSDVVRNVVAQLQAHGKVTRSYLGVEAQQVTPAMARALSLPSPAGAPTGALVASVSQDSPAEKAGIKPGDVLTAINGQTVATPRDLAIKVAAVTPGSDAKLSVIRNGAAQTISAHLATLGRDGGGGGATGNGQTEGSNASIGVALAALTPDLRQQLGLDESIRGVVVHGVRSGSAADQAGIRPGDIILGIGSQLVSSPRDAVTAVHAALKHDQSVALRILRDGHDAFVAVSPSGPDAGGDGSGAASGDDDSQDGQQG